MADIFTRQIFESSIMDACLSTHLDSYLSLGASIPIPRGNRTASVCDSGVGGSSLDSLLSDLLQSAFDKQQCGNCDELMVVARCRDCRDVICESCVDDHRMSRFSKNHLIVRFASEDHTPPSTASGSPPDISFEVMQLLAETQSYMAAVQKSCNATQDAVKMIEASVAQAANAISETTRMFVKAMMERQRDLLNSLESVRVSKINILRQQSEEFCSSLARLRNLSDGLMCALERGSGLTLWQVQTQAVNELAHLRATQDTVLHEDSMIKFLPPDALLLQAVRSMGRVSSNGCTTNSVVEGSCNAVSVGVLTRDLLGEPCDAGIEALAAVLAAPDSLLACPELLTSFPQHEAHDITTSRGLASPFNASVQRVRDYRSVEIPALTFGVEGDEPGQLCRPWGVCCDRKGNFVVADRSNNRIQVFHPDGSFKFEFGSHGSGVGQMDRPSSVAINLLDHIVVVDKDNHRVQVFSDSGKFLFTFGGKGCKPGQFNYPWDAAVNSRGQIVVSDTRNHRIQLFSPEGEFVDKYGFEGQANMWKHFDSPRGVTFNARGQVIVTDFNNHRLVIIEPDLRSGRFLGSEGAGEKQFLRPQGVAVDAEGHILVADSRNHRVQVFDNNGNYLHQFGSQGKGPGEVDRPSGICLAPDGKIAVVDFGNNRIHIY